ncbi:hypothetical protein D0T51_03445 [Parabacteroides sp. 52]|uniref:putative porin n=1 Tax=unclassified Parabacteroides TaxID=2649774 RepID=UPI0013D7645D|nr:MULTISPECIES: putative porin [unclassified Parabacteroides]MDH6534046.1 hypothetical protein [Parabacteroides sp. PM5-20]NDV54788.1 hypothetical protein [Parabacteroides sp. 52]
MKQCFYIVLILIGLVTTAQAQPARGGDGGFSLANLTSSQKEIPDSLLLGDSLHLHDKGVKGYHLTPYLGEAYLAPMDTNRLNFSHSTFGEGYGLSMAYLANIGSPMQTRLFHERKEARDFLFADAFDHYITTPENAYFYDTKSPYTHVAYTFGGGEQKKEERLKGVLTLNFGKKINVGGDLDYIYTRGFYNSNGVKQLSYRLFGNYLSDRYEMKAFVYNFNFVHMENGGLSNDSTVTHPDDFADGKLALDTKSYPVRYSKAFNRVRGKQFFLTHRYNLGFNKTLEETDEEGNERQVFVPVSSIIHTLHYEDNRRHFTSTDTAQIDAAYPNIYEARDSTLHDRPSAWTLKNTIALSLREGFQDWAKFGLAAFIRFENRQFKMAALNPRWNEGTGRNENRILSDRQDVIEEFSTYLGGELSKRQGSILTYNARGELCIVGEDLGEFRLSGELQSQFNLFQKKALIRAEGHIKNTTPAFYARRYQSRYYVWNNNLSNEREVYAGGTIDLQSSRTQLSAGVTNLENYVYFGSDGTPGQHKSNIQIVSARIKQDVRYRAFGWENEIAYQLSGEKSVLPLPELSIYSNMYFVFKLAKVLTCQVGADVHYFTAYYAPYYEPATQQFQLQRETGPKGEKLERTKVGNYPLINAYVNFHLKQARFFVSGYNLGQKFIDPNHFSLAHYPLNPFVLKFGIAVYFNN